MYVHITFVCQAVITNIKLVLRKPRWTFLLKFTSYKNIKKLLSKGFCLSPWTNTCPSGSGIWRFRLQTAPPRRGPWSRTHRRSCVCSRHWGWCWRCWSPWTSQQLLGCLGSCQDGTVGLISLETNDNSWWLNVKKKDTKVGAHPVED